MGFVDFLTQDQASQLMQGVSDDRDRALLLVGLTVGTTVSELMQLTVDAIDWDARQITIPGKRQRTLPLTDQTYESLAQWSQSRIQTPERALFITQKGKVKGLSSRSIEHIIKTYGKEAQLPIAVTAHVLRSTFAVHLFDTPGMTLQKAGECLGLHDDETLRQYKNASQVHVSQALASTSDRAELPKTELKPSDLALDTRSFWAKLWTHCFPTEPKLTASEPKASGFHFPDPKDPVLGREPLVNHIKTTLLKGQSVTLVGGIGLGKTHILEHLHAQLQQSVYAATPVPIKSLLKSLCEAVNPNWTEVMKPSASAHELLQFLKRTHAQYVGWPILIVDQLERLRVSDVAIVTELMELGPVLGAMEAEKPALKPILWKSHDERLEPLDEAASRQLIQQLTAGLSVEDPEMLETYVLGTANGNPLAMVDMVKKLSVQSVIRCDAIRDTHHEAGKSYRDWTGLLMVVWAVLVASRFIALGTHSFEGYVLAGFGTSVFVVIKYYVLKGRR